MSTFDMDPKPLCVLHFIMSSRKPLSPHEVLNTPNGVFKCAHYGETNQKLKMVISRRSKTDGRPSCVSVCKRNLAMFKTWTMEENLKGKKLANKKVLLSNTVEEKIIISSSITSLYKQFYRPNYLERKDRMVSFTVEFYAKVEKWWTQKIHTKKCTRILCTSNYYLFLWAY